MANNPKPRFCWDSCCFLSWFQQRADRHAECAAVIEAAKRGDALLYASTFALAECVYVSEAISQEDNTRKIEAFFRNRYIRLVDVNPTIAARARALQLELRAIHKVDPWDAVHLATAIHLGVEALHTYDDRDLVPLNGRLPGVRLRIGHPDLAYQLPLPYQTEEPATQE